MKIIAAITVSLLLAGCSTVYKPTMRESAIADTVSTAVALEYGNNLHEMNPLGFPATIIGKAGLIYYAENHASLEERELIEKYSTTIWSGASINNISLLLTISPQLSLFLGIITSIIVWNNQ
jgi:uncharacterized protein YceK